MGLFRGYNTIPPTDFPSNWLSESKKESERIFKIFCYEKLQILELKRIKKFLKKKSVQEFMNPIIKNEYYKIVNSMTEEELNQMLSLSNKQYKKKLFGLVKNKDVKISIGGNNVIPHKLKSFSPIILPKIIQKLVPSEEIEPKEEIIKICKSCDKGKINRGMYDWETRFVPEIISYKPPNSFGHRDIDPDNSIAAHYEDLKVSLERKCDVCDGKWKTGFTFKDFLKYIKNFNEEIGKINKEIIEVNEKGSMLAEEYNNTIKKLNAKISIWNAKCPYNAVDKKHESDNDYFLYWGETEKTILVNESNISNNKPSRGALPKGFVKNTESLEVKQDDLDSEENSNGDSTLPSDLSPDVNPAQSKDDPLEVLKIRFAKGEITMEEFKEIKKVLYQ